MVEQLTVSRKTDAGNEYLATIDVVVGKAHFTSNAKGSSARFIDRNDGVTYSIQSDKKLDGLFSFKAEIGKFNKCIAFETRYEMGRDMLSLLREKTAWSDWKNSAKTIQDYKTFLTEVIVFSAGQNGFYKSQLIKNCLTLDGIFDKLDTIFDIPSMYEKSSIVWDLTNPKMYRELPNGEKKSIVWVFYNSL